MTLDGAGRRQPRRTGVPPAFGASLVLLCAFVVAACWAIASPPERPANRTSTAGGGETTDAEFAGVAPARRLAWFDRQGQVTLVPAPPRGYAYPRLAPDGRRIVVDVRDEGHGLWLWDDEQQQLAPLSVGRASDIAPLWTHDGSRLVFARGRGVAPGLFTLAPGDLRLPPQRLPVDSNSLLMPSSLTPGDHQLLVTASVASGFHIYTVDWQATGRVTPFITSAADDLNAEVSPDGRWVAFQSRASGQFDIWLAPAPSPSGGASAPVSWPGSGAAWRSGGSIPEGPPVRRVTMDGGTRPVWAKNGRELLYLTTDGEVMGMEVALPASPGAPAGEGAPWPQFGPPTRLFRGSLYQDLVGRTFDVTPDGSRILAIVEGTGSDGSILPPGAITR